MSCSPWRDQSNWQMVSKLTPSATSAPTLRYQVLSQGLARRVRSIAHTELDLSLFQVAPDRRQLRGPSPGATGWSGCWSNWIMRPFDQPGTRRAALGVNGETNPGHCSSTWPWRRCFVARSATGADAMRYQSQKRVMFSRRTIAFTTEQPPPKTASRGTELEQRVSCPPSLPHTLLRPRPVAQCHIRTNAA
jgi:hypothetical protein